LPDQIEEIDDNTALKDHALILKYEDSLETWAATIKETLQKVKN